HTSRAEHRLLLRHDNADLRLSSQAYRLGLIDEGHYARVERRRRLADAAERALGETTLTPSRETLARAEEVGLRPISQALTAAEVLRRPEAHYWQVRALAETGSGAASLPELDNDTAVEVELRAKYAGFVRKERQSVQRALRLEEALLPETLDYAALTGLRN